MYQITRLENGLTVATAEMPHMASVSLGIWIGIGGRYEPAPISGISHFIEHLLFKGTKKRNAAEISQSVEGIGGYLNAWTGEENTCFYSKGHAGKFDELLDVLADMFLNSVFDKTEIEKERDVVKEEIAMYRDQPQQYVHELLNETLWPDQPLGRTLTGTEKTLDAIKREHLLEFLKQNYIAPATLIVAAGNIEHKRVLKSVSRYAKHFPQGKRSTYAPSNNDQTAPRIRLHTKKTEQTQLALGIRTVSRHDERRHALRLLNTILGENMSSRLFQSVREEHGLAYSIYSSPSFFDDTGDLVISAGLDADNLGKALKLISKELKRLIEKPISAAELRRARDYAIGQLDLSLENTEPQMMWIGEHLLAYGKVYPASHVKKKIAEVTASQIRAAANDFFKPERMNLALVSPLKKLGKLKLI
ncbi:MAG: Peptidase domain protein [Verrucomicrobiales bacterium]|nr:Peptidase domain protein [Verrucomicrobiales bacterium]